MVSLINDEKSTNSSIESLDWPEGIRYSWQYSAEPEALRGYLGMSGLGDLCNRKIWYGWRWATKSDFPPRVRRIFERGDWEEPRMIRDLKAIGVECFMRDESRDKVLITGIPGEKQESLVGFSGHAGGHPDGRLLGVPEAPKTEHLAEFKTANEKGFNKFVKLGVELANIVYYGQVQVYMKRMKLTRCLFGVTNKNTEERYWQRIKFNPDHAQMLIEKERNIILSEDPPEREYTARNFECKFCSHRDVCHNKKPMAVNCRTCNSNDIYDDGVWKCSNPFSLNKDKILTLEQQAFGCSRYKSI